MKSAVSGFLVGIVALLGISLRSDAQQTSSSLVDRLKAADDARVAAILAADRSGLQTALSSELRYAHSNGVVDTRESFIDALCERKMRYLAYEHQERHFTFPAPGIALMSGRARMRVIASEGEVDTVLGYLGVWREEAGKWKFIAWQSCRLPAAAKSEATKSPAQK
jgi:hypothetical protein